jgi:hypothetical protein
LWCSVRLSHLHLVRVVSVWLTPTFDLVLLLLAHRCVNVYGRFHTFCSFFAVIVSFDLRVTNQQCVLSTVQYQFSSPPRYILCIHHAAGTQQHMPCALASTTARARSGGGSGCRLCRGFGDRLYFHQYISVASVQLRLTSVRQCNFFRFSQSGRLDPCSAVLDPWTEFDPLRIRSSGCSSA